MCGGERDSLKNFASDCGDHSLSCVYRPYTLGKYCCRVMWKIIEFVLVTLALILLVLYVSDTKSQKYRVFILPFSGVVLTAFVIVTFMSVFGFIICSPITRPADITICAIGCMLIGAVGLLLLNDTGSLEPDSRMLPRSNVPTKEDPTGLKDVLYDAGLFDTNENGSRSQKVRSKRSIQKNVDNDNDSQRGSRIIKSSLGLTFELTEEFRLAPATKENALGVDSLLEYILEKKLILGNALKNKSVRSASSGFLETSDIQHDQQLHVQENGKQFSISEDVYYDDKEEYQQLSNFHLKFKDENKRDLQRLEKPEVKIVKGGAKVRAKFRAKKKGKKSKRKHIPIIVVAIICIIAAIILLVDVVNMALCDIHY